MGYAAISRSTAALAVASLSLLLPYASASAATASAFIIGLPAAVLASVDKTRCSIGGEGHMGSIARPALAPQTAKRAAILGGEISALDRIRMQQVSGLTAVVATNTDKTADGLSPEAGADRLKPTVACSGRGIESLKGDNARLAKTYSSDDFLASRRVPIGTTSFDADWQRVSVETVAGTSRKLFGKGLPLNLESVMKINQWVNREIAFIDDRVLYDRADYWAGARQTLRLRQGDCEDIALTKMQLLAAIGFARENMFLSIVRDKARSVDHAVLAIRFEGQFYILDNMTDTLLDGRSSNDYAPIISFNKQVSWLHGT